MFLSVSGSFSWFSFEKAGNIIVVTGAAKKVMRTTKFWAYSVVSYEAVVRDVDVQQKVVVLQQEAC